MIHALGTLIGRSEFQLGLGIALLGLAIVVLVVWGLRGGRSRAAPIPLGGAVIAGATVVAMPSSIDRKALALALAGLAAGSMVAGRLRPWAMALGAVPGAVGVAIVVTRPPAAVTWPVLAAVIVASGALAASFEMRHARSRLGQVLVAVTAAGVYVTVPDTEAAAALLGAAIGALPPPWRPKLALGRSGAYVAAAVVSAVASDGGRSLGVSGVAAIGCMGLLTVEPLVRTAGWVAPRAVRRLPSRGWELRFVAAHAAVVAIASRVAGQSTRPTFVILVLVVDAVLAACLTALLLPAPEVNDDRARRREADP